MRIPTQIEQAWAKGVEEFNAGNFWEAHEDWEHGWKDLAEPVRSWVQAWIQLAGAIHLSQKGRHVPARALCVRALEKLAISHAIATQTPRIEVEGGLDFLKKNSEPGSGSLSSWACLKAKLTYDDLT